MRKVGEKTGEVVGYPSIMSATASGSLTTRPSLERVSSLSSRELLIEHLGREMKFRVGRRTENRPLARTGTSPMDD